MTRLGDYELEKEIGRGGMGSVFRARHVPTGAIRALKVLDGAGDPELVARFRREAEGLARVGARVAVAIHEFGHDHGRTYFAMDLLAGGSLADRLARSPGLPWRDAVELVARLARGIERCHAVGIVHRDLKPANVLFDGDGAPILADFGCARDLAASTLTEEGTALGTPSYMSPEQLDGHRGDARSDVYALAVLLHELVSGARPHAGRAWHELLIAARKGLERPIAARAGAPVELDRVLARALAPDPALRTPSALAFALELEALLGEGRRVRRPRAAVAVVAGLLALTAIGLALFPRKAPAPARPEPPALPAPRPAPGIAELEERLRRGAASEGEVAALAALPGGDDALERLAHDAVLLPLERVREAARHAEGRRRESLAILEAVASLTTGGDAAATERALRGAGMDSGRLAARLADAVGAVARVLATLPKRRENPPGTFEKDTLESPLADLRSYPKLLGWAVAPLSSECRADIIADTLAEGRLAILGQLVRDTPSLLQAFDDLPPQVAIACLVFRARSGGAHGVGVPLTSAALSSVSRRLAAAGDPLLEADAIYLTYQLPALEMPRVPVAELLADVTAKYERQDRLLAPYLASDPSNDAERFARFVEADAKRRISELWIDRCYILDRTSSADLEAALAAAEVAAKEAFLAYAWVENQDHRLEWAEKVVLLRLVRGESVAYEVQDLDRLDPLRVLGRADATPQEALDKASRAMADGQTPSWLVRLARVVHSRASLLLGDRAGSELDEEFLGPDSAGSTLWLARRAVERAFPAK